MTETKTQKQVVSGGFHRPVCKRCNCEMRPETNGVGVLDIVQGRPYELWSADLWRCPGCGVEIVGGYGNVPIAAHYESDFTVVLQSYESRGLIIRNNE